jgi:uncharacterized membrane-anchored protein YhcB (DUF1043 family)
MSDYGMSWYSIIGLLIGIFIVGPVIRMVTEHYEKKRRGK